MTTNLTSAQTRAQAKHMAIHRGEVKAQRPQDAQGRDVSTSEYFGENVFDVQQSTVIPDSVKAEVKGRKVLSPESGKIIAKAVSEWCQSKGVTHFCHWFQPLTGGTAEKHDAFLHFDKDSRPIESLSGKELMQGEPDASSFPHGGSRSTFEARGYTTWDTSSPLFIIEGTNGKTLCIPTAFISYTGDALDIKTPLLRSVSRIDEEATKFLNLIGQKEVNSVKVTCGAEQEYFLVDKSFYYLRPDLVMSGRTLFGSLTARNQQLSDHYFGTISERVLSYMQDLETELYKVGIPAKTRHNEVAPGQFEIACIYQDVNVASDHNQLVMATLKRTALKHDMAAIVHEKPFGDINGNGKHLNWSFATDTGENLLNPGAEPHQNQRFLAFVSMVLETVYRRGDALRMAIASAGNDHRLGGHEAPPSVISVFVGDTLAKIFESMKNNSSFTPSGKSVLDLGVGQLSNLLKDNTDRNRTSPFAFTGDKFEFRAVGGAASIGFPLSILNAAFAEVLTESNEFLEKEIAGGKSSDDALAALTSKWLNSAEKIIFNGDGYGEEWIKEAESRGLPNLRTTADSLDVLKDESRTKFLVDQKVFTASEIKTRYNVLLERYNQLREIEFHTLRSLVDQNVIPAAIEYRAALLDNVYKAKKAGTTSHVETEIAIKIGHILSSLVSKINGITYKLEESSSLDERDKSFKIANEIFPLSEEVASYCNKLEDIIPDAKWDLPKYFDLLFVR